MSSTLAFEIRFTKKESKKPVKFIQLFYEYAPTLHYYARVKFEQILQISLNSISCFVKYNLYLVCVSRWHRKLFAYFKTVNISRTKQVIEKLKTLLRSILVRCSTDINTTQRIFNDTAPLTFFLPNSIFKTAHFPTGTAHFGKCIGGLGMTPESKLSNEHNRLKLIFKGLLYTYS